MNFSIRELLLVTVIVAILAAWWTIDGTTHLRHAQLFRCPPQSCQVIGIFGKRHHHRSIAFLGCRISNMYNRWLYSPSNSLRVRTNN